MYQVIKNKGKVTEAYKLGEDHPVLNALMGEGRIVRLDAEHFEIFSKEAVLGGSGHGERAAIGDYIKIDSAGDPYPNTAEFFEQNHRHLDGDRYEQIPHPLAAWDATEPMCPEIEFLVREKGLCLDEAHPERYYSAELFGTMEVAAKNSVLIFYHIDYAPDGTVRDADYNFVERGEFEKTYSVCQE